MMLSPGPVPLHRYDVCSVGARMTNPWESSFQFRLPAIQMTIVVGFKPTLANPNFDCWRHLRI
jgi:hypothetical protein